jgi:hypothetical protein
MATVVKDFRIKAGLVVEGSTATVNGHDILTESLVDAKGDLLVGSADNTVAKLTAGTNGYVLTANSGATNGIEWAAPAAVGVFDSSISFEGSSADDHETTLQVTNPTADRTITLPDATGQVVLRDSTDTLSNKSISLTSNTVTGTLAEFNTALSDADFATIAGTETLTNKTLTSPKVSGLEITDSSIVFEGATANTYETTLQVTDPTDDRTITLPDSSGTVALTSDIPSLSGYVTESGTQTLTNKTLTSPSVSGLYLSDGSFVVEGATANDHETTVQFTDPTADRTITFPDATGTVALTGNVLALSGGTMSGAIAMGTSKITGLGTPTDPADATTKAYVDSVAEGLHIHESARAATTANVNLANALENGDTLDGVTLATNDRVLVKNQTTTSENGIYVVQASGQPTRATDFDTASEVDSGDFIFVYAGTVNAGTGWVQTNRPATIGTDPIVFTQFSGAGTYIGGAGLTLDGNTFNVGAGTGIQVNADTIENTGVLSITGTANQISATASTGAITLSGPQDLHSGATPSFSGVTVGSVTLTDALLGTATATASTSATVIDSWSATTYSSAKYIVQMKKGTDIEVIEVLVTVDGSNNVYLTEYADVISNAQLGTTDADYNGGNVRLLVTGAAADTVVKVNKVYIEA